MSKKVHSIMSNSVCVGTDNSPHLIQITSLPLTSGTMPAHFAISVPEVACAWGMQDLGECSVLLQQLLQAEGYRWRNVEDASPYYDNARYLYVRDGEITYGTLHGTYCYHTVAGNFGDYGIQHTIICLDYFSEACVRKYLQSRAEYSQE